jgi:hypothetical protein
MAWVKEPPIKGGKTVGCLNCGYKPEIVPLGMRIAVGFGAARLTKNGEVVWEEGNKEFKDCITVAQAEEIAAKDPDNDWRIELYGPLSEAVYQRHNKDKWVLIKTGLGFA